MSKDLKKLYPLEAELQEINDALKQAAQPLDQVDDLNEEQRDQVGVRLRAGIARWDTVTEQIAQMLKNYKPDSEE